MPNESHQSYRDRPRDERKPRAKAAPDSPATESGEASSPQAEALAGFQLLADPATISGGARDAEAAPEATTRDSEVERLRSALHLRSRELETLRQKWRGGSPSAQDAPRVAPSESPVPTGPLLDAASARRMAAEARKRERASREALEAAQRALEAMRPTPADEEQIETSASPESELPFSNAPPRARVGSTGWERLPLVSADPSAANLLPAPPDTTSTPQPDPVVEARPASTSAPETSAPEKAHQSDVPTATSSALPLRSATDSHERDALDPKLEAAQAEIRELEATLAIARETTVGQRSEIEALRSHAREREDQIERLQNARSKADEEPTSRTLEELTDSRASLQTARSEIDRLQEQLARSRRSLEEREAERILLERSLEERDSILAARAAQLDELRDRFDAQERALHAARHEYEQERGRHSESLQILARLRATLSGVETPAVPASDTELESAPLAAGVEFGAEAPVAATPPDRTTLPEQVPQAAHPQVSIETPAVEEEIAEPSPLSAPPEKLSIEARAPIFEAWQDDQIRRHFGPMGIDTFIDLLRAPLERRKEDPSTEQAIVLIGRGAGAASVRLAEGLVELGPSAFRIHVVDPEGPTSLGRSAISHDSPLREFLAPVEFPESPAALEALLGSLQPSAIVTRDFLSREEDVETWLACFERAIQDGSCLLLSEATGVDRDVPPPEMTTIGDRIWELMPARYTRLPNTDLAFESWLEAFEGAEARPSNHLVTHLRDRFRLEMFTQFGFLAEPFLASPIAKNFDADAPRDRRFLSQVADLDDRKIEAGLAPALHLVALVDPLAET